MLENVSICVNELGADHFRRSIDDGTAASTPEPALVDANLDQLPVPSRWWGKFGGTSTDPGRLGRSWMLKENPMPESPEITRIAHQERETLQTNARQVAGDNLGRTAAGHRTPGRVSFQIPAAMVQLAVRLVHAVLDLRTRPSPAVVRAAS